MSLATGAADGREAEIRLLLGRVTDPELDEPVTELGFITGIEIDDAGGVRVGFRLPTYWCAANFAFMMADDMRREIAALPWVRRVEIELGEHMYAETINRGIVEGLGFQQTFGEDASADLDALRRNFLVKAFQRRQEALLTHLLATGWSDGFLVGLSLEGLRGLALDAEGSEKRERYLARRDVAGAAGPEAAAFVDADARPLAAAALPEHLRALRRIGVNMDFNGALCRGLLASRFNEAAPRPPGAEPGLVDFLRAVPAAGRGAGG